MNVVGVPIPVLGQHHKGSFQPGGMRHVVDFGASGLRLAGASAPRLSQASGDWLSRARAAVAAYDDQIRAASTIADDTARGQLLMWVGRADVPGSPAERYGSVLRDIAKAEGGTAPDQVAENRLRQLESSNAEFTNKVSNALSTYGVLPVSGEAGSRTEVWNKSTLCVAGGIALLALVVVPLLLD